MSKFEIERRIENRNQESVNVSFSSIRDQNVMPQLRKLASSSDVSISEVVRQMVRHCLNDESR